MQTPEYPFVPVKKRRGNEPFRGAAVGARLLDFWRWYGSDILGNTVRGNFAEFIVALDLGVADGVQNSWESCDLTTKGGHRVEVKASAYIQTWAQKALSRISFDIAPKRAWNPITDQYTEDSRRWSDVYVFALLASQDQTSVDPLDLSQWEFYLLPTDTIDEDLPRRKRISLSAVKRLGARFARFGEVGTAISALGVPPRPDRKPFSE